MEWGLAIIYAGLLAALAYSIFRGFGLGRIYWWNVKQLKAHQRKMRDQTKNETERMVSQAIRSISESLQSKLVLTEADLNLQGNTHHLVGAIAVAWNPESAFPLSETTLGRLLEAFQELHCRLMRLTQYRGIYAATQFRLRHVIFLNHSWKKKQTLEATPIVRFVRKFHIDFLGRWVYTAFRLLDLSFWAMKMATYFIYDVWLKTLLIHWYLIVGELADNVYRHRDGKEDANSESILEAIKDLPEPLDSESDSWPQEIREITQNSRQQILFSWGALDWKDTQEIYGQLIKNIAQHHFPKSTNPMHEATIFSLLASTARFSDKTASLKSLPLIQKLLDIRVSHLLLLKNVADWASDNQVFEWIKKHDFHRATRYATILFKTVRQKHPGILFKELAWLLVSEGLKRWGFLHLHQKIAFETQRVYSESNGNIPKSE